MTLISDSQRWPSITHPLLACLEALTLLVLLLLPVCLLLVLPRLMFDALVKLLVLVIVNDLLCLDCLFCRRWFWCRCSYWNRCHWHLSDNGRCGRCWNGLKCSQSFRGSLKDRCLWRWSGCPGCSGCSWCPPLDVSNGWCRYRVTVGCFWWVTLLLHINIT